MMYIMGGEVIGNDVNYGRRGAGKCCGLWEER
jgi:hypothetical protein